MSHPIHPRNRVERPPDPFPLVHVTTSRINPVRDDDWRQAVVKPWRDETVIVLDAQGREIDEVPLLYPRDRRGPIVAERAARFSRRVTIPEGGSIYIKFRPWGPDEDRLIHDCRDQDSPPGTHPTRRHQ